jgi:hypothetical protein
METGDESNEFLQIKESLDTYDQSKGHNKEPLKKLATLLHNGIRKLVIRCQV